MGLKESGLRGSIRNVSTGIGAAITIDTLEAENVETDSATIRGEITELTNFGEDAEVFFEWGEITEGLPNTTDIQLQDAVGVFTEDLTNLSENTTHEFQAFGSVQDVSDEGVVLTFETDSFLFESVVLPEEDDLSHFDGPTFAYDINSDTPVIFTDENNLSLKLVSNENPGGGDDVPIISTSGLDRYPEPGEKFACYINDIGDLVPYFYFGVQDESNYYAAGIFPDINEFRLSKNGVGGGDTIDTDSVSLSLDEWYDVEVEWETDGTITARCHEVDQSTGERESEIASASANDTDYTDGGVGFGHSSSAGSDAAWDFYRITEIL